MASAKPIIAFLVTLTFGCFLSSVTNAQSSRELINDCLKALANGNAANIEKASDAVKKIRGLEMPDLRDRIDATTCLNKASGEAWQYLPDADRIVPKRMIKTLNEAKQAEQDAALAFQYANEEAITSDVFNSCERLYAEDKVSAMTNEVCIAAFQNNHHPTLPAEPKFIADYVGDVLSEFSKEELSFIMKVIED